MRPFALIRTREQWACVRHQGTALDEQRGEVSLAWEVEGPAVGGAAAPSCALAFDSALRLYQALAPRQLRRWPWLPAEARTGGAEALDLFAGAAAGDFHEQDTGPAAVVDLVIDGADRLVLAGSDGAGKGGLWPYNLRAHRALPRIALPALPRAVAVNGETLHCVTADGDLYQLTVSGAPVRVRRLALPGDPGGALRLRAAPDGALFALVGPGTAQAQVVPIDAPAGAFAVPGATDLAFLDREGDAGHVLVVARGAGQDFWGYDLVPGRFLRMPLRAWDYRGDGIVRTPDGRVGYVTDQGVRHAFTAPVRYPRVGRLVSFRLDGGAYQQQWGRIFMDACQPAGTEVRVAFVASDEFDGEALAWAPPANSEAPVAPPAEAATLPPRRLLPAPLRAMLEDADVAGPEVEAAADLRPLHRRAGTEQPWAGESGGGFATYEGPVLAPAGRYLWVIIELRGTTRKTPRVRSVRVEYPGHGWLQRLPRVFSRDEDAAWFLQRYLALPAGALGDLEARAEQRHLLVDPRSAPAALLPWLGSLLGLVIDDKWSEAQRRRLIAAAAALYRERGTAQGLRRLLEIYTGGEVRLVEHHQLRGGSSVLGDQRGSVAGEGMQPGAADGPGPGLAHRCLLVVLTALDAEQRRAVERLVREHCPAHVRCELCVVETGMRVGVGLRVGVSAMVGRDAGFGRLPLGGAALGRGGLLGPRVPDDVEAGT